MYKQVTNKQKTRKHGQLVHPMLLCLGNCALITSGVDLYVAVVTAGQTCTNWKSTGRTG